MLALPVGTPAIRHACGSDQRRVVLAVLASVSGSDAQGSQVGTPRQTEPESNFTEPPSQMVRSRLRDLNLNLVAPSTMSRNNAWTSREGPRRTLFRREIARV